MRVAVDTCVGKKGIDLLCDCGHEVVVEAGNGETDREWFARALRARVEVVISPDSDVEILCYDHRVEFFEARQGLSGMQIAHAFVRHAKTRKR